VQATITLVDCYKKTKTPKSATKSNVTIRKKSL